jgi:RNA polymerase sigma factor (sigma-70 family)
MLHDVALCPVDIKEDSSITLSMSEKKKPSIQEVIQYAKPIVKKFIGKHATDIPHEQKEEIEQECYLRLWEAYEKIDPEKGWKSFVYNHCRGSVLDYLKAGKGFSEEKWTLSNEEEEGEIKVPKMRDRAFMVNTDDDSLDIDTVLGASGVFSTFDIDRINIRWNIVAKLASTDEKIHVFAKWLRGFNLDEMGVIFGLSKSRIAQMISDFIQMLDDVDMQCASPWVRQTIYAFGLSMHYGIEDIDQSRIFGIQIGQDLIPVNLDSFEPFSFDDHNQMGLFD